MMYGCDCPFCEDESSTFNVRRNPSRLRGKYRRNSLRRRNPKYEVVADWGPAVKKLLNMGYTRSELARLLCESLQDYNIKCSIQNARPWFILGRSRGGRRPPPPVQKAIVRMSELLKPVPWKEAVDDLVSAGYSINKIAYLISQKVKTLHTSITRYLYGYRRPPLETQLAIVKIADEFVNIDPSTIIIPKSEEITRSMTPEELESIIIDTRLRAQAIKLREQGTAIKDISKALGIGWVRLKKLLKGVESPSNQTKRKALKLLDNDDLTFEEIASELGVTRQTISNWAREASIPRSKLRKRATKKEKDRAINMCRDTEMSYEEIGKFFKRHGTTIRKWCIEAGVVGKRDIGKPSAESIAKKRKRARELCNTHPDLSFVEIGRRVGASGKAIKNWCKGIRKVKPRTPPGSKEAAFQLFLTTNLPDYRIGEEVGVSGRTIGKWRKEFNKLNRNPLDPEELEKLIIHTKLSNRVTQLREEGLGIRAIAKKVGLPERAIREILGEERSKRIMDPRADKAKYLYITTDMTNQEIAEAVGATRQAVWHWVKEINLDSFIAAPSENVLKKIVREEYKTTNIFYRELAEKYNVAKSTIAHWCRDIKKEWQDPRIKQARELCEQGIAFYKISEVVGVSDKTIAKWCSEPH